MRALCARDEAAAAHAGRDRLRRRRAAGARCAGSRRCSTASSCRAPAAELARRALPDARRIEAFDGVRGARPRTASTTSRSSPTCSSTSPCPRRCWPRRRGSRTRCSSRCPLEDNRSAAPARPSAPRPRAIGHLHFFSRADVRGARRRRGARGPGRAHRPAALRAPRVLRRRRRRARRARPPSGPCGPRRTAWRRGRPRRCSPCTTRCWLAGRRRARRPAPGGRGAERLNGGSHGGGTCAPPEARARSCSA